MADSSADTAENKYDPVYLHARREAVVVLVVWVAGLAWTVGYCFLAGYDVPLEQLEATLGMPSWVFWGVLIPWVIIVLFSIWFGLYYIADDRLGQEQDKSEQGHFRSGVQSETHDTSQ